MNFGYRLIGVTILAAGLCGCIQVEQNSTISKNGEVEFRTDINAKQMKKLSNVFASNDNKNAQGTDEQPDFLKSIDGITCERILEEAEKVLENKPNCMSPEDSVVTLFGRLSERESKQIIVMNDDKTMDIDLMKLFAITASFKDINESNKDSEEPMSSILSALGSDKETEKVESQTESPQLSEEAKKKEAKEMMDMFEAMGMKMNLTVQLPGKVVAVNGETVEDGSYSHTLNLIQTISQSSQKYVIRVKPRGFLGLF